MQKGHLRGVEQHNGAGRSTQESGDPHRDCHWKIFANIVPVRRNRRKLPGPEGNRIGCIGLDGQDLHPQDRGKQQKRAPAGNRVQQAAKEGRHREPEPMPVDVGRNGGENEHLVLIVLGAVAAGVWPRFPNWTAPPVGARVSPSGRPGQRRRQPSLPVDRAIFPWKAPVRDKAHRADIHLKL